MIKTYCTQNDGYCKTCSLASYGRDCQNNPLHGGTRPGAGRKPNPVQRKTTSFKVSETEKEKIRELLKELRK